ncbi:hypothetical protein WR25_09514 [Diploscapter pachys]|uniref:PABS domain-containing protein n=1 Tax=Diploscapter pachys TaxID=2018661 RepID=A0A2A2J314_9BILA|nr:hypothetical protein WR25_09514 [Diploscapter pachys]
MRIHKGNDIIARAWLAMQRSGVGRMGFSGRRKLKWIFIVVAIFFLCRSFFVITRRILYGELLTEKEFFSRLSNEMKSFEVRRPDIGRMILMEHLDGAVLSSAILKPPNEFFTSSLNTTSWDIDFTVFYTNSYIKYFFDLMFYTQSVPASTSASFNALSLGMGGGTINTIISKNFPNSNMTVVEISNLVYGMAKKWFGLDENDRHHVIIEDGLKFVQEASKRHDQYDVIFLDACRESKEEETQCPIAEFHRPDILQYMHDILKPTGGIFVNLVIIDERIGKQEEERRMATVKHKFDQVLACRKQPFVSTPQKVIDFVESIVSHTDNFI